MWCSQPGVLAYVPWYGCAKNALKPVGMVAAGVAELADALDLGSSDANRGGSSPPARTSGQPQDGEDLVITGYRRCK
jgi:hypothetical protein